MSSGSSSVRCRGCGRSGAGAVAPAGGRSAYRGPSVAWRLAIRSEPPAQSRQGETDRRAIGAAGSVERGASLSCDPHVQHGLPVQPIRHPGCECCVQVLNDDESPPQSRAAERTGAERPVAMTVPHTCGAGVLGVHRAHLGDTVTAENVSFKRATHPMKHPSTDLPPFIHALLLAIAVSAIVGWALTQLIP